MAINYIRTAAAAEKLLAEAGAPDCSVVRPLAAAPDGDRPWRRDGVESETTVAEGFHAVLDNTGLRRGKYTALQALTETASGKAYAPPSVTGLLPGDYLIVPAGPQQGRYLISRVEPVAPGGVLCLWELSLRA